MRSKASYQGHPIHPMLIPFPFAFLTGAFVSDALGGFLGNEALVATAGHLTLAGIAAGLLAAIPGIVDYFYTVPPDSSARVRATNHARLNIAALALFAGSWFLRPAGGAWLATLALEALGVVLLMMAGYMGGTLVFRNQIGVDHRYADAGRWHERTAPRADGPVVVADSDDVKVNQMALGHVGGRRIAVGRTEDGCHAFDDRCTHKGGPLSDGALICGIVQCPWHGSQFDVRTGEVKAGPAKKKIATYPVEESNAQIRVRA